jgi:hypothetical protein
VPFYVEAEEAPSLHEAIADEAIQRKFLDRHAAARLAMTMRSRRSNPVTLHWIATPLRGSR